jgi:hypothetical protein
MKGKPCIVVLVTRENRHWEVSNGTLDAKIYRLGWNVFYKCGCIVRCAGLQYALTADVKHQPTLQHDTAALAWGLQALLRAVIACLMWPSLHPKHHITYLAMVHTHGSATCAVYV